MKTDKHQPKQNKHVMQYNILYLLELDDEGRNRKASTTRRDTGNS
jgi:hypothetical protein